MKNMKSFSVRGSGRKPGKFYIDCAGHYAAGDIAEVTGTDKQTIENAYKAEGAELDDSVGVYYFSSREAALAAVRSLEEGMSAHGAGKVVFLTFEEIEYIRQALINEGSNIIYVRNDLKKTIFDKFNG